QPARIYRIGVIGPPTTPPALRRALAELGYVEARNLVMEHREDRGDPRGYAYTAAEELLGLQVDLIVAANASSARTASTLTATTPIVATGASGGGEDLVAIGVVPNLSRPSGNVTGVTSPPELPGKRLQLLTEAVPGAARVAVLHAPGQARRFAELEDPARQLGVQLIPLPVSSAAEIDGAFDAGVRERADALVVVTGEVTGAAQRHIIVGLAASHRLPTAHEQRIWVVDGGLMYYGPVAAELYRRVDYYVDRILKGAKPADLPVEQPTTFDFVINLKTAQALGLPLPQHVLLQATEVIQ